MNERSYSMPWGFPFYSSPPFEYKGNRIVSVVFETEAWEASYGQPLAERTILAQRARHACQGLRRYGRVFPVGQPRAWLWQGLYE